MPIMSLGIVYKIFYIVYNYNLSTQVRIYMAREDTLYELVSIDRCSLQSLSHLVWSKP